MGKLGLLSVACVAILLGCGPGTPVGDALHPEKICAQDLTLENQGTKSLVMYVQIAEASSDAGCKAPFTTHQEKTVEPGGKDSVHVELTCRQCGSTTSGFSIYRPGQKTATMYDKQSGSNNVFCSDTVCLGRDRS